MRTRRAPEPWHVLLAAFGQKRSGIFSVRIADGTGVVRQSQCYSLIARKAALARG